MQAFLDRLIAQGVFGSLPTAFVYTGMMFLFGVLVVFFRPIADITSLVRVAGLVAGTVTRWTQSGRPTKRAAVAGRQCQAAAQRGPVPGLHLLESISAQNFAGWTA